MKINNSEEEKKYMTVLQLAISCKFSEVVKFLIEKGANVNGPHVYIFRPSKTETIIHTQDQIEMQAKYLKELEWEMQCLKRKEMKLKNDYLELKSK